MPTKPTTQNQKFISQMLRFKEATNIEQDKEAAELLGMTFRAYAGRKVRGVFPEKDLYTLHVKRPDLKLDIEFILNGAAKQIEAIEAVDTSACLIRNAKGGSKKYICKQTNPHCAFKGSKPYISKSGQGPSLEDVDVPLPPHCVRCIADQKARLETAALEADSPYQKLRHLQEHLRQAELLAQSLFATAQ